MAIVDHAKQKTLVCRVCVSAHQGGCKLFALHDSCHDGNALVCDRKQGFSSSIRSSAEAIAARLKHLGAHSVRNPRYHVLNPLTALSLMTLFHSNGCKSTAKC